MIERLPLTSLRLDGGTQLREKLNEEVIEDYAERMKEGAIFPAVIAFFDGESHWLADGFHRWFTHQLRGEDKISVDVRMGSLEDAILYAAEANAEHGLRRTPGDIQKTLRTLEHHFPGRSARWYAEKARCSASWAGEVLGGVRSGHPNEERSVIGRDGNEYRIPPRPQEVYAFDVRPDWSEQQRSEAHAALERLREQDRRVTAVMISEPDIPSSVGVDMARRVASAPEAERKKVIDLYQSPDSRDKDQAITLASARVCMPDPRLVPVRVAMREIRVCIRQFPDDHWTGLLSQSLALLTEALEGIASDYEERRNVSVSA